jgi:prephenate dehydrogenase
MPGVRYGQVTLVGVGLLGGSLGLALRQRRVADRVVGYVRREASVDECIRVGAVDEAMLELEGAVRDADLVVLCTPIGQMASLAARLGRVLRTGAMVTDVGSVKRGVVEAVEPLVAAGGGRFVGSHPMAGAETMGVRAARADLYDGAVCVVTPTPRSDPAARGQVEALWKAVGARTLILSPEQHDDFVSHSSHLVQLVAAQLVHHVLTPTRPPEQARLCGTGFRDATRIASGSPEMWRDIAVANRDNVGRALDELIEDLRQTRVLVASGDAEALSGFFARAKQLRDGWLRRAAAPE